MRPISVIVAAAAGVIAPLALALPALAQDDDNSDGVTTSGSNNPDITIYASSSTTTGDVSILIDVTDLAPFMDVELASPALDAACDSNDLDGVTAEADRNGHLDVTGSATDCVPGTYRISLSEQQTPFRTFSDTVTID